MMGSLAPAAFTGAPGGVSDAVPQIRIGGDKVARKGAQDHELVGARNKVCRGAPEAGYYWQSCRALAVHAPKPLAIMLRMTEQT